MPMAMPGPANFATSRTTGSPPPSGVKVMVTVPAEGTRKSVALSDGSSQNRNDPMG